jgi:hypothetical protein
MTSQKRTAKFFEDADRRSLKKKGKRVFGVPVDNESQF